MAETLSAILSGVFLVLLSMIAGGIIYVLAKDFVKRNIQNKE